MSLRKETAFKNLKLDAGFFEQMMRPGSEVPEELANFDVYLMENNVLPVLVQGLDALSRHVDTITLQANVQDPDVMARFNPLIWLAQYILRNHPKRLKDHRTPMYQRFVDLANIERGRRELLSKQPEIEAVFMHLVKELDENEEVMTTDSVPLLVQRLDDHWLLNGQFLNALPKTFGDIIEVPEDGELVFHDFWRWFERYVRDHDILRAESFEQAATLRLQQEKRAEQAKEDAERREMLLAEALKQRTRLEEKFEMYSADMYINDEINLIINKGYFIDLSSTSNMNMPAEGEHVVLIRAMLSIWGCPLPSELPDTLWTSDALEIWQQWISSNPPEEGMPLPTGKRVDGVGLRRLMDKEAFQDFLERTFPMSSLDEDDEDYTRTVVIKHVLEDDQEFLVETFDESSGQVKQYLIPGDQVEEVQAQLMQGLPVLATVDTLRQMVTAVVPATSNG